jgi:undecaprenyl pyrophosphate synthase
MEQLKNRGYISAEDISDFSHLSKAELLELLQSKEAYQRTISVHLLSNQYNLDEHVLHLFLQTLSNETKLYTKMELCHALSKGGISLS